MNVLTWLKTYFTHRGKALWLYRRGMAKAKRHDHQAAIDDYTEVIGLSEVPADVRAMALFNRALVHVAQGNRQRGAADLATVLAMEDARENVKLRARQKLVRMESRSRKDSA